MLCSFHVIITLVPIFFKQKALCPALN
jgi:hypothetical protein